MNNIEETKLNIKHYKKIFVVCPQIVTGGPETHHNLVSVINDAGGKAYIVYTNKSLNLINEYSNYKVLVTDKIEDEEDNLLIVSEILTDTLFRYKKIKKAIMFLSLRFYKERRPEYYIKEWLQLKHLPQMLYPFVYIFSFLMKDSGFIRKFNFKKINFNDKKLILTCNGEVNKRFLVEEYGVDESRIGYICGPLNSEFLIRDTITNKESIVCYNPKKGLAFTTRIISKYMEKYNNVQFIPIQGLSAADVHSLLARAKVYIDFGNHPGPERIPREAVVSKCNILTSTLGSAGNQIDVPIPSKYKFDCDDTNIEKIVDTIKELVDNHELHLSEYDSFREKVLNQPRIFKDNVLHYFYYKDE